MDSHCRLCGDLSLELHPILEDLELPNKIFQLYHVKVDLEDQLPTLACRKCLDMVQSEWLNYLRVQKAQQHLNEILESLVNVDPICHEDNSLDFTTDTSKVFSSVITNEQLPKHDEMKKNIKSTKVKVSILYVYQKAVVLLTFL